MWQATWIPGIIIGLFSFFIVLGNQTASSLLIVQQQHHHCSTSLTHVQRRATTRRWALKDGAQAQIDEYRKQLAVYESSPTTEDNDEEEIRTIRTICDCATALVEIDRDILTFQEHLEGDDARLKEIAKSFRKEFLECKDQIETQLNSLL